MSCGGAARASGHVVRVCTLARPYDAHNAFLLRLMPQTCSCDKRVCYHDLPLMWRCFIGVRWAWILPRVPAGARRCRDLYMPCSPAVSCAAPLCGPCTTEGTTCVSASGIRAGKAVCERNARNWHRRKAAYEKCAEELGIRDRLPLPACCDLAIKRAFPNAGRTHQPYKPPPGAPPAVMQLARTPLTTSCARLPVCGARRCYRVLSATPPSLWVGCYARSLACPGVAYR